MNVDCFEKTGVDRKDRQVNESAQHRKLYRPKLTCDRTWSSVLWMLASRTLLYLNSQDVGLCCEKPSIRHAWTTSVV